MPNNRNFNMIIAAFIMVVSVTTGCRKTNSEAAISKSLPGEWQFTSMKLDGVEAMGSLVESGSITFSAILNGKGTFHQEVKFRGSGTDTMTGTATVDDYKSELTLETDEKTILVKLKFPNSNTFYWESEQEGKALIVKAKRKTN